MDDSIMEDVTANDGKQTIVCNMINTASTHDLVASKSCEINKGILLCASQENQSNISSAKDDFSKVSNEDALVASGVTSREANITSQLFERKWLRSGKKVKSNKFLI